MELEALLLIPVEHGLRVFVGNLGRAVVEGGLGETLFVNAGLEEELVGDDRVIHAHAAFVENAHDGLLHAQLVGELLGEGLRLGGHGGLGERLDVGNLVLGDAGLEPLGEFAEEVGVVEVVAPEGGVFHAGLGEAAVEVEHADETGPSAGPIGDGEDRPAVRDEAVKNVVGILPDGLGDDDRRVGVDGREDLHAFFLRGDEAVFHVLLVAVRAHELVAEFGDGGREGFLHFLLGGPADGVGGVAKVAVGDERDGVFRCFGHGGGGLG